MYLLTLNIYQSIIIEPIILKTKRLQIIPLTAFQLDLYARSGDGLIKNLGLNNQSVHIPKKVQEVIRLKTIAAVKDPANNALFSTFWTIINLESNCMVGDLCFKGNPNELGEVEIGYGTHAEFQKKGFMTEAVGGLLQWALEQENVNYIWAETDPKNVASQKVLSNNDFEKIDETPENIYWRISKK
ncbi:MAG: ribosomal-protein-alanine N-acetyltransferase [Crocinitomix sp.]|jgi:ribosomal-protein-alanine N-acetyltransferase